VLRRISALLRRDLLNARRDYMVVYAALTVPIICLAVRLVLPSFGQTSVSFVVPGSETGTTQQALQQFGSVAVVADEDAVRDAVRGRSDVVGVLPAPDSGGGHVAWRIVVEGDEPADARDLAAVAIASLGADVPRAAQQTVGDSHSLVRDWVAVLMALTVLYIGIFVVGLGLVEDQEEMMTRALGVTPLTRREYVGARALLGTAILLTIPPSMWLLGSSFDAAKLVVASVACLPAAVLFGFLMATVSPTLTAALANFKFANLLVIGPALATLVLPSQVCNWALGWLAPYWCFRAFQDLLMEDAGWGSSLANAGLSALAAAVALSLVYPVFRKRLTFALD
jgi:hypothetical protein